MRGLLQGGALCLSSVALMYTAVSTTTIATPVRAAMLTENDSLDGRSDIVQSDASEKTIRFQTSSTVVRTWIGLDEFGMPTPFYAISLNGNDWAVQRAAQHDIVLRDGGFDPLQNERVVDDALKSRTDDPARAEDPALFIVQFVTQALPEYREAIEELGGTVHHFVPNQAHVVRMTPSVRDAVAELPFVRWAGDLHPAFRLDAPLVELVLAGDDAPQEPIRYNIMTLETDLDAKFEVANRIAALGGIVDRANAGKLLLEATLTPSELAAVAGWSDVLWIDPWGPIETDMENAREIGGANYVESLEGWDGAGVRGEVLDVGFNPTHVDFQSRPPVEHTPLTGDSHGAATSGIIFGDGTGNPLARGMVPAGQAILADTDYVFTGQPRYDHTAELNGPPYFATFHSSSVGSPQTTSYTNISAEIDQMLFDHDILHCQSQSNTFTRNSRPQAWAKNIVSVGGIRHMNTLTKTDDCWGCGNGGASIGPADDGRIKPDLAHFYDNIFTTTSGSNTAYTSGFGGTSGATPIVAGHFGIFMQMWNDGIFGNIVDPFGTPFTNRPHMTTSKAIMINSASQYSFSGATDDLTRVHQGWGLPDLRNLYDRREDFFIVDESSVITNLETQVFEVNVGPGEPAARFTMTYADPAGVPFSGVNRINDLSMRVTSPNGDIYHGNVGLLENMWSVPGGSLNTIDTVENVFVENPAVGLWTIEIIASEINTDGHTETPQLDADFALVVSGVEQTLSPLAIVPGAWPELVAPGEPTTIDVRIIEGAESLVVESAVLRYRFNASDAFSDSPMTLINAEGGVIDFEATLPGASCTAMPEFYFFAEGDLGSEVTKPTNAPDAVFTTEIGVINILVTDDFEVDAGWTVENDANLTDGQWERAIPAGGGDRGDPINDSDGSGFCFVTDNEDGNSDIDGGITSLISPVYDVSDGGFEFTFDLWYTNFWGADPNNDLFEIFMSDDAGNSWNLVETIGPVSNSGWQTITIPIDGNVTPTTVSIALFAILIAVSLVQMRILRADETD